MGREGVDGRSQVEVLDDIFRSRRNQVFLYHRFVEICQ